MNIGKYKSKSIEDFEELYKRGKIEEKDSWSDYQKLDHLKFKKDGEAINNLLQF